MARRSAYEDPENSDLMKIEKNDKYQNGTKDQKTKTQEFITWF